MTQVMMVVCHDCKVTKGIGSFSNHYIDVEAAYNFFVEHKGHSLQIIGDDGGWEVYIGKLVEKGYKINW